jgi:hypothetical protein
MPQAQLLSDFLEWMGRKPVKIPGDLFIMAAIREAVLSVFENSINGKKIINYYSGELLYSHILRRWTSNVALILKIDVRPNVNWNVFGAPVPRDPLRREELLNLMSQLNDECV